MAFRQPQQRPQNTRQISYPPRNEQAELSPLASPLRKRALEDSEEWVLFSPSQAASVVQTETTSTERTPRTIGLSQFSDFGSLDTAARSDQVEDEVEDEDDDITEHGSEPDEEAELDSLDDGLHAFNEPDRLDNSGGTVLPTHDGLGTFGTFGDGSAAMQQQLWQFERPAAKRKLRRPSSVQRTLDALEEAEEYSEQHDRIRRIEQWRLEQSRALLEEIERETRRMHRISRVGSARSRASSFANGRARSATTVSARSGVPAGGTIVAGIVEEAPETEGHSESFWQRFTHKVIRSLIGIDENLLSIILGEDLVQDVQSQPSVETDPPTMDHIISLENRDAHTPIEETWQHRLMVRIARELGVLVHQMSEHPGAFSTYLRTQETPSYAGLPPTNTVTTSAADWNALDRSVSSPLAFNPTLGTHQNNKQQSEASLWGIEEEGDELEEAVARGNAGPQTEEDRIRAEREYWERELDVKMVFNFLKSRFSSPTQTSLFETPPPVASPHDPENRRLSIASALSVPSSARRAALIRQQHPLTSRAQDPSNRRRSVMSQPASLGGAGQLSAQRSLHRVGKTTASSSCASQSTKKSKRSGSSRNYWDHSGSVGSGPTGAGGMGAWGEVAI